jgi:hypothetical protein
VSHESVAEECGPDDIAETVEIEDSEVSQGRQSRGRKRKYKYTDREVKKRKNSNLVYTRRSGNEVQPKKFLSEYNCRCRSHCMQKLTESLRRKEFSMFWQLGDYNAQNAYIAGHVKAFPKKRKRGHSDVRKNSREYSLGDISVCRQMFTKTLRISTKRVNTCMLKKASGQLDDKRGCKEGSKTLPAVKRAEIKEHINSFPRYKSHYTRAESEREFLNPELTLAKMYELYKDKVSTPVSLAMYKKVFYQDFNLRFKQVKKDTCKTCDEFSVTGHSKDKTADEKAEAKRDHEDHLQLAEIALKQMNADLEAAVTDETLETLTFDLQKVISLPRIHSNIVFYKRQLSLYNLGIHSGKRNEGHFNVWLENEGSRGAQDIGSVLMKHITEKVPASVRHLILWSDSCGGQNRNIKITLMMQFVLQNSPSLQSVCFRFRVSGHSFLPNDSEFGDVECALKRQQRLYLPDDVVALMRDCRRKNKFIVSRMSTADFVSTAELEKMTVNRKVDVNGVNVSWMKTREIKLLKSEPEVCKF